MSGVPGNTGRLRDDGRRRAALGKIHIAKVRLGLDDELYRAIIARVAAGKRSSADLDERECGELLDEFKRLGFCEGNSFTTSLDAFEDREPQARLIRALWADLKALGVLKDSSEKGLRRFIRRVVKVDDIAWLNSSQANAVIEALKARKVRARAAIQTNQHQR